MQNATMVPADPREVVRGIVLPLPTPFDGRGRVDEDLLAQMATHYVGRGVGAFFLLGSFGQGPAMEVDQRKRVVEVLVEAVGHEAVLIPQVGGVDPYTSRDLAEHAVEHGIEVLASVGPYYYADRSEEERREHFAFVFEDLDRPVLIYNNTDYQGYAITPWELVELRERVPGLFAVKIAKGNVVDVLRYRDALGSDFKVFAPQENLFPGMLVGQSGTISPPMSSTVELGLALVRAIDEGRYDEAARLQVAVLEYVASMRTLSRWGRSARAEALRHLGFPVVQYPRWPTPTMPEDAKERLHAAIDAARASVDAR